MLGHIATQWLAGFMLHSLGWDGMVGWCSEMPRCTVMREAICD